MCGKKIETSADDSLDLMVFGAVLCFDCWEKVKERCADEME